MKVYVNVGCGKDFRVGDDDTVWINVDQHSKNWDDFIARNPGVHKNTRFLKHELPQIVLTAEGDRYVLSVRGSPLPFEDCSVDKVLCSHVVEDFVYEFMPIIKDFRRVLKVGGVLHLKVPEGVRRSIGSYHHLRYFSKDTIRGIADESEHYEDKRYFDIRLLRINRYGLFTCAILAFLKLTNQGLQRSFWREYGKVEKRGVKGLKWWIDLLYKLDPRWGKAKEIEAVLVKV